MKRKLITTILIALTATVSWAVPAQPGSKRIQQPDGTFITVSLHGDEYLHYTTTDDGYTVVRDAQGCYVYAEQRDGQLVPSAMRAHDASERTLQEQRFLTGIGKHLSPAITERAATARQNEYSRRAKARARYREPQYDYNQFRGLIILVQFNDRKFSRADYTSIIEDMVNKENYRGYDNTSYGRYTGSVRDYFYDNSNGLFSPQFDIVGPVTVERSQYFPQGTENATQLVLDVLDAADSEVDFSLYDGDDDGIVDMVYFIFAGIGANITGNDERLVWPHAGSIYNPYGGYDQWAVVKDDILLWSYACSTELYGSSSRNMLDGIGTICHEFGHVLGLPDLYDTNYEEGGQSVHPGEWSVMAGGSYMNNGRTPVGYNLYERYAVGFAMPERIAGEGSYELESVAAGNTGYRLDTRVNREFFLLENPQKSDKWDRYLPGHGLLVYRVDSTNNYVWQNNQVNANSRHSYFELLRAAGYSGQAAGSDPFPGSRHVTELNNATTPASLKTWSGTESPFGLANISENGGIVSFDVEDVTYLRAIALPETAEMSLGNTVALTLACTPTYGVPESVSWNSSNTDVATVDADGRVTAIAEGETVITATTVNKRQEELTATCRIIVELRQTAPDIAAFNALGQGALAELKLDGAQVLQVYDGIVFLRDSTAAITLSDSRLSVARNDILSGTIYGVQDCYDRMPAITPDEGLFSISVSVTTGGTAEAEPIAISIDSVGDSHYANLLTLKKVKLERLNGGIWTTAKNGRAIKLWNTFALSNISVPRTIDNKRFDVTGILTTRFTDDGLIDELALMGPIVEAPYDPAEDEAQGIDGIVADSTGDGIVTVYTADGRRLSTAAADRRRPGLYIVRQGQKTMKVVTR